MGLGNRFPGLRPERWLDVRSYLRHRHRPHSCIGDDRPHARVVRHDARPVGFPVEPERPGLWYGRRRLRSGQGQRDAQRQRTGRRGHGSGQRHLQGCEGRMDRGAGIEGALWGGWSAKLEYLYIDLGKTEQTATATTAANLAVVGIPGVGTVLSANANQSFRTTDNIVRVGLNYKWGSY